MARQKREVGEEGQPTAFASPLLANGAVEALGHAGEAWMRACGEVQKELASFVRSRIEHDMEHAAAIAQCRNIAEVTELQQNWMATALHDYAAGARQLAQVATDAIGEGMTASAKTGARAEETIFSTRSAK